MSIAKALFDQSIISTDECFGQPDVTSQEMRTAINAWRDTYLKREGDKTSDPCMRMAYVIVHKLQKGVFAEYSSDILDKEKTAKGKWMNRNLSQLDLIRDSILQWMLIGGECWVKPIPRPGPDGSTIFAPLLVHRTDAVILAREPDGRVTSIVTAEHTARGSQYYTLLERRTVDANGYLTIENKLYASFDRGTLGVRTALSKLDRYAQLPDLYTYPVPVGGVGMTPLRVPLANCVDGSMDAISIYEPAMGLIRNIDQNEKQLNDEFELAGEGAEGGLRPARCRFFQARLPGGCRPGPASERGGAENVPHRPGHGAFAAGLRLCPRPRCGPDVLLRRLDRPL